MLKKILVMGVVVVMALGLFVGCGGDKLSYNAVFFDAKGGRMSDEFRVENRLGGIVYGFDNDGEPIFMDESYPPTRTVIVTEQDKYAQIYVDIQSEAIDFEKEMLLLYTFGCSNTNRKIEIKSIRLDGDILRISWAKQKGVSGNKDSSEPQQRWIVLKTDRLDIKTAEFKEI